MTYRGALTASTLEHFGKLIAKFRSEGDYKRADDILSAANTLEQFATEKGFRVDIKSRGDGE